MSYFAKFLINLDQREERISDVPPFHWSKIPQKIHDYTLALYLSSKNTDSGPPSHAGLSLLRSDGNLTRNCVGNECCNVYNTLRVLLNLVHIHDCAFIALFIHQKA